MAVSSGRRRTWARRSWAVLALSAAFHLGLVAVLVRGMHVSQLPQRTVTFEVQLLPPPAPRIVRTPPMAPAPPRPLSPRPARDLARDRDVLGAPPPIAAPPEPQPPAPAPALPEPDKARVEDLRRALRAAAACADDPSAQLSEREQAVCAQRRVQATPAPFDPAKAGRWSAFAAQAELQAARRREREGPMPNAPVEACQGAGSNLGFGCVSGGSGPQ